MTTFKVLITFLESISDIEAKPNQTFIIVIVVYLMLGIIEIFLARNGMASTLNLKIKG